MELSAADYLAFIAGFKHLMILATARAFAAVEFIKQMIKAGLVRWEVCFEVSNTVFVCFLGHKIGVKFFIPQSYQISIMLSRDRYVVVHT